MKLPISNRSACVISAIALVGVGMFDTGLRWSGGPHATPTIADSSSSGWGVVEGVVRDDAGQTVANADVVLFAGRDPECPLLHYRRYLGTTDERGSYSVRIPVAQAMLTVPVLRGDFYFAERVSDTNLNLRVTKDGRIKRDILVRRGMT